MLGGSELQFFKVTKHQNISQIRSHFTWCFWFFFFFFLSDRYKRKVLGTVRCFRFWHCKGRSQYQISRVLGFVLLLWGEKKNLMMFILEILSFVDVAGLDAGCTGPSLWGVSQMCIISIPSNFIPVEPDDSYNVSVLHIGKFSSYEAKDRG